MKLFFYDSICIFMKNSTLPKIGIKLQKYLNLIGKFSKFVIQTWMNELIQNGDFVNIYMHEKTKKNIEKNIHIEKTKTTIHDFKEINSRTKNSSISVHF